MSDSERGYRHKDKCPPAAPATHKTQSKGVKCVKTPQINLMPSCDADAEHTIGRAATFRQTLDHNIIYVSGENLKL